MCIHKCVVKPIPPISSLYKIIILKLQKFSVARLTTPAAQAFYFHNLFQSFDTNLQQIIAQSIYYKYPSLPSIIQYEVILHFTQRWVTAREPSKAIGPRTNSANIKYAFLIKITSISFSWVYDRFSTFQALLFQKYAPEFQSQSSKLIFKNTRSSKIKAPTPAPATPRRSPLTRVITFEFSFEDDSLSIKSLSIMKTIFDVVFPSNSIYVVETSSN